MLGMPVMLGGFSIPHSLSFLEGFSYTKNNGYLDVITGVSGLFNPRTQLNDALIALHARLTGRSSHIDIIAPHPILSLLTL